MYLELVPLHIGETYLRLQCQCKCFVCQFSCRVMWFYRLFSTAARAFLPAAASDSYMPVSTSHNNQSTGTPIKAGSHMHGAWEWRSPVFNFWFVMPRHIVAAYHLGSLRGNPGTVTIPQYQYDKTNQHTQQAIQVQQERIQLVRSNRDARKRPTESNGTPAMDLRQMKPGPKKINIDRKSLCWVRLLFIWNLTIV